MESVKIPYNFKKDIYQRFYYMKEKIRVAGGQGFWGDLLTAPVEQVRRGQIDYLMLDYLAEVTMSILQKQRIAMLLGRYSFAADQPNLGNRRRSRRPRTDASRGSVFRDRQQSGQFVE